MSSTGRNLATNSKAMGSPAYKTNMHVAGYGNGTQLVTREDGFNEIVTIGNWQGLHHYANGTLPQAGESFTTSCNVRNDRESACRVYLMMFAFNASGTRVYPPFSIALEGSPATQTDNKYITLAAGEERRLTATVGWTEEAAALLEAGGNIRYSWQALGANVAFWAYKLEYGTAATPWRAAPEDTEQPSDLVYASEGVDLGDTSGLDTRLTTAESSITQQAGQIALKANAADVYTKQESTALLEVKANKATLTSEINASADTVKIDATRVNITGEAVFSAINGDTSTTKINGGKIDADTLHVKAANIDGSLTIGKVTGLTDALDGKADDADVTAAISTAAADATSKANAAQAAAEATASADATSKANAAAQTASKYITAIDQSGIKVHAESDPTENYAAITSDGMEVVKGAASVAEFGEETRIGLSNKSHMELDARSMQMWDESRNYLNILDLRNSDGNATVTESFVCDGETSEYEVAFQPASVGYVRINGTDAAYTRSNAVFTLDSTPAAGDSLVIQYVTTSGYAKAFTFGARSGNTGAHSVSMGYLTAASGSYASAFGYRSKAAGNYSQATGDTTEASGVSSFASGNKTVASGEYAFVEGSQSVAGGSTSHAEGFKTETSGFAAHSEGSETSSIGSAAHSEGFRTKVTANYGHAEGLATEAGERAHAEGAGSKALGAMSHAGGENTIAARIAQTAIGRYNVRDTTSASDNYGTYALIIGNGTSDTNRSNALTVEWDGTVHHGTDYQTSTIGDIFTAASGVTVVGAQYAQWGKMAQVYLQLQYNSNIGAGNISNINLGTIAAGKRPAIKTACGTGEGGPVIATHIFTSGAVVLGATAHAITAGTTFTLGCTYILA